LAVVKICVLLLNSFSGEGVSGFCWLCNTVRLLFSSSCSGVCI
jgi:hypothetical protein